MRVEIHNRRYIDVHIRDRGQKALMILSIFTGSVISVMLIVILFWLLYPYKTIDTGPQPYQILGAAPHSFVQGETFTYRYRYDKYTNQIPEVRKQFVDGLVFDASSFGPAIITGKGSGTAFAKVQIPDTLPPGEYFMRILVTYKVNPLRDVTHEYVTEKFTVVPLKTHYDELQDLGIERNSRIK